jgi:hypothetical protein
MSLQPTPEEKKKEAHAARCRTKEWDRRGRMDVEKKGGKHETREREERGNST